MITANEMYHQMTKFIMTGCLPVALCIISEHILLVSDSKYSLSASSNGSSGTSSFTRDKDSFLSETNVYYT
jgi:hypothetical protein